MISICSNNVLPEITIFTDSDGLRALAMFLRARGSLFICEAYQGDLRETCIWLNGARYTPNRDKLVCMEKDGFLEIEGNLASISWLSEYLEELAGTAGFEHVHIGYYDGHPFLQPNHIELIVCEV
jgi:hypothetical protein